MAELITAAKMVVEAELAVNINCCSFSFVDRIVAKQSSVDSLLVVGKFNLVTLITKLYHLVDY